MNQSPAPQAPAERIYPDPMSVPFVFVTTTDDAITALSEMAAADMVAVDTETEVLPGSDLNRDGPGPWCVLSAAARIGDTEKVWVFDMTDIDVEAIGPYLSQVEAYCWNAAFERLVFLNDGVRAKRLWDLMLAKAVLDQGLAVHGKVFYMGLAEASQKYLGVSVEGKGGIQLSYKRGVPLSDEQKAYAAQDAIVTLWLEPLISAEVDDAGLAETVELECRAQPFIDDLKRNGLWLDRKGWMEVIAHHEAETAASAGRLAQLTGGGQSTLFSEHEEPMFKPGAPEDVKKVLNTHAEAEVRAFFASQDRGKERLLGKDDSVDHDTLQLIGGPLASELAVWHKHAKVVTTYGAKMMELLHEDGRFHARFLQALVDTGRLSSDGPNMQNLAPGMKQYLVAMEGHRGLVSMSEDQIRDLVATYGPRFIRVFVHADLSQAELRMLAQESGDEALTGAFVRKEDIHVTTAGGMFGEDMAAMKAQGEDDPAIMARYTELRAKGKTLNFGVCYGLGAPSLAKRLTVAGVDTSVDEAKELLALYDQAYPGIASWLSARDQFIADLATNPPECDWALTWKLHANFQKVKNIYWNLRKRNGVSPTAAEIAEEMQSRSSVERELERHLGHAPSADELDTEIANRVQAVEWIRGFKAPVVVMPDGQAFAFESRTRAGRRRLFNVTTDEWITSMMVTAARSRKPRPAQIRNQWAAENNMVLCSAEGQPLGAMALKKKFEGRRKVLKENFVSYVLHAMPEAAGFLMRAALGDVIKSKGNQYRNAPIQGGVADAVLHAYGLLDERLDAFEDAFGVQSVHDSIVVECALVDAPAIADMLRDTLEEALARYCPDVPVVADVDIQASLDAKYDLIEPDRAAELIEIINSVSVASPELVSV